MKKYFAPEVLWVDVKDIILASGDPQEMPEEEI